MTIMKNTGMKALLTSVLMATALLSGCEVEDEDGNAVGNINLPQKARLDLFCDDVGVGFEPCVLDDPENPFADVAINDDSKFVLFETIPSNLSSFYLWATAQALGPRGENQYYTALSLHRLYGDSIVAGEDVSAQEIIRDQALKAYKALLDNHFNEVTFFGPVLDGAGDPILDEDGKRIFTPASLKSLAVENLWLPTSNAGHPSGLRSLFTDNPGPGAFDFTNFEVTMGRWGYTVIILQEYDPGPDNLPFTADDVPFKSQIQRNF